MTIELLDSAPPNAEETVVAWLAELGRAGVLRKPTDPLPFRLVHRVTGTDDLNIGSDDAVVSIHTFDATMDGASAEADRTHARMLYLAKNSLTNIDLIDGTTANVDFVNTVEKPIYVEYGDPGTFRYVARYRVGFSFVTTVIDGS